MRRPLLGVPLLVLVTVAGLYVYGRYLTCPPPDWWVRLFLRSGNVACVQR